MPNDDRNETAYSNKRYYLAIWTGILRDLRGWSSEQVQEWAEKTFGAALDDEHDLLFHVSPQYWIRNLLIPERLRPQLSGIPYVNLLQDLEMAFWDEQYPRFTFPTDMDWKPYRERVARVLRDHLGPDADK